MRGKDVHDFGQREREKYCIRNKYKYIKNKLVIH